MTTHDPILRDELLAGLRDAQTGWNMGSFGAIAEFHHVRDETPGLVNGALVQSSHRGGVALTLPDTVRPVAFETVSPRPHRWAHGVALCLPAQEAARHQRAVLTEIGPDEDAVRDQDRGAVLFDMGLAQPQVDFCVRTADPELITLLRTHAGRSLFEPDNPALGVILSVHPHRVALTRLGRVEVFQKIGGPDTGGVSPEGPHTHVLPKLLRSGRTHSANMPIPQGWVPCAAMHPENPVIGRLGEDKDLNRAAFDAFQRLLRAWGAADYLAAKEACWAALEREEAPESCPEPGSRIARAGLRNGLRQWGRLRGGSALLTAWNRRFDARALNEEIEEEAPGH